MGGKQKQAQRTKNNARVRNHTGLNFNTIEKTNGVPKI